MAAYSVWRLIQPRPDLTVELDDEDRSADERSAARQLRAERWQEYTAAKEEQIRCKLEVPSLCGLPRFLLG